MAPPDIANRIGYIILGLTNNLAYVVMLSAAYDLLKRADLGGPLEHAYPVPIATRGVVDLALTSNKTINNANPSGDNSSYCNEHSTSTILLADSVPSLTVKLMYPLLLVNLPLTYKAIATAGFSALSFIITGYTTNAVLIFAGVALASLSCGLGETIFLSTAPQYGAPAISGWSMGTGASGLVGSMAYAVLKTYLEVRYIMTIMLVAPLAMLLAYFIIIRPTAGGLALLQQMAGVARKDSLGGQSDSSSEDPANAFIWIYSSNPRNTTEYGTNPKTAVVAGATATTAQKNNPTTMANKPDDPLVEPYFTRDTLEELDWKSKLRFLPALAKYFLPLFLVYFAEFFINQGLHELIYYPEIGYLNHAAQYRWFQVVYQLGVMVSRSSLDCFVIRHLWSMAILQVLNGVIFYGHAAKWFHIPSFYIMLALIFYEGLLGGFIYSNTFYRMREELRPNRQEFGISTVVVADTLGIVLAGSIALPVHDNLCKLYI